MVKKQTFIVILLQQIITLGNTNAKIKGLFGCDNAGHFLKYWTVPNILRKVDEQPHIYKAFHNLSAKDIHQGKYNFSQLKGKKKAILVVNFASESFLSDKNFKQLNEIYEKYSSKGLEIIAMPSNDFKKEPRNDAEIKKWVYEKYDPKFVILSKDHVNGPETSELYTWLRQNSSQHSSNRLTINGLKFLKLKGSSYITYDYEKFLMDEYGYICKRYGPLCEPKKLENDIISHLHYM